MQSPGCEAKLALRARLCMCNVAKELDTAGTDNVGEWWLVRTSADLFIRDCEPAREYSSGSQAFQTRAKSNI